MFTNESQNTKSFSHNNIIITIGVETKFLLVKLFIRALGDLGNSEMAESGEKLPRARIWGCEEPRGAQRSAGRQEVR